MGKRAPERATQSSQCSAAVKCKGSEMGDSIAERGLSTLFDAALSKSPAQGYTHTFYRYPAGFSPKFTRAAIETFSKPGDVVLDPFMGGGTTLVEALATGRDAIGSDINSLAHFVTRVKTHLLILQQQM
jgi:DNA methylase